MTNVAHLSLLSKVYLSMYVWLYVIYLFKSCTLLTNHCAKGSSRLEVCFITRILLDPTKNVSGIVLTFMQTGVGSQI